MNSKDGGKVITYKKNKNQLYNSINDTNNLSSNIHMTFNIINPYTLPKDSKIEILEANCIYSIQKIDKDISINGNKTHNDRESLEEYILIEKNYMNSVEKNCSKFLINIIEKIEFKLKIVLNIKGLAYYDNCNKIYFEAEAEGVDCINTIFISETWIPNMRGCINDIKLKCINNIEANINPSYVFLSPLFDSNMNIDTLLGNVFINYELDFKTSTIIPSNINVCKYNKVIYNNIR